MSELLNGMPWYVPSLTLAMGILVFYGEQIADKYYRSVRGLGRFQWALIRWSIVVGVVDATLFCVASHLGKFTGWNLGGSAGPLVAALAFPWILRIKIVAGPKKRQPELEQRWFELYRKFLRKVQEPLDVNRRVCLESTVRDVASRPWTEAELQDVARKAELYYLQLKKEHRVSDSFVKDLRARFEKWQAEKCEAHLEAFFAVILAEHSPRSPWLARGSALPIET